MNTHCDMSRQLVYWGQENQDVLAKSVVAIIGVGGLGSVVAEELCRLGVGTLLLCDEDVIADHNLHRQHLYEVADIGKRKVLAAKEQLLRINPNSTIHTIDKKATKENLSWALEAHIIIDCTDRHESRREIDAFCTQQKKPWIHGAAVKEKGTVFVFLPENNITYNDIYGLKSTNVLCKDVGVLVTTTTMIGSLQASFAVQFLLKRPLPKTLLRVSVDTGHIEHIIVTQKAL